MTTVFLVYATHQNNPGWRTCIRATLLAANIECAAFVNVMRKDAGMKESAMADNWRRKLRRLNVQLAENYEEDRAFVEIYTHEFPVPAWIGDAIEALQNANSMQMPVHDGDAHGGVFYKPESGEVSINTHVYCFEGMIEPTFADWSKLTPMWHERVRAFQQAHSDEYPTAEAIQPVLDGLNKHGFHYHGGGAAPGYTLMTGDAYRRFAGGDPSSLGAELADDEIALIPESVRNTDGHPTIDVMFNRMPTEAEAGDFAKHVLKWRSA